MKSRIYNNVDGAKDFGTYMELPLWKFLMQMPQYAPFIVASAPRIDFNDSNYIVRFVLRKNDPPLIEIGYPEDAEWQIGKPDSSKQISYPEQFDEMNKTLDAELAKGGKFLVLPIADFLKIYPKYGEIFSGADGYDAICLFRSSDNKTRCFTGSLNYSTEKWEQLIQTSEELKNACHP